MLIRPSACKSKVTSTGIIMTLVYFCQLPLTQQGAPEDFTIHMKKSFLRLIAIIPGPGRHYAAVRKRMCEGRQQFWCYPHQRLLTDQDFLVLKNETEKKYVEFHHTFGIRRAPEYSWSELVDHVRNIQIHSKQMRSLSGQKQTMSPSVYKLSLSRNGMPLIWQKTSRMIVRPSDTRFIIVCKHSTI